MYSNVKTKRNVNNKYKYTNKYVSYTKKGKIFLRTSLREVYLESSLK